MKPGGGYFLCLVSAFLFTSGARPAAAQAAPQLPIRVLDVSSNPEAPVAKASVEFIAEVAGSRNSAGVEVTDAGGRAVFHLPPSLQAADEVEAALIVTNAGNLVLYQPEEGKFRLAPSARDKELTVRLVPKGSPALLEHPQLEAFVLRLIKDTHQLNFAASLRSWAEGRGFRLEQVEQEIQLWIEETRKDAGAAGIRRRALAEFAAQNYAMSAELFGQAANADEQIVQTPDGLRRFLDDQIGMARALAAQARYAQARAALAEAFRRTRRNDHRQWRLDLLSRLASSYIDEGDLGAPANSAAALKSAIEALRQLLGELSSEPHGAAWAEAQLRLGNAQVRLGERTVGPEARQLLADGVGAYLAAQQVYTKDSARDGWAALQLNLGSAYSDQAEQTSGPGTLQFLRQAVAAYRASLEVYTKAEFPADWAMAETSLGGAFLKLAMQSAGPEALQLLDQAVQAEDAALQVYSKTYLPQSWAKALTNRGTALLTKGQWGSPGSVEWIRQAVTAFRGALEVFTKDDQPQDWATTQNSLALALDDEARRTAGAQADQLFQQSEQAYRATLEVDTKSDLPQSWARTQNNLGNLYNSWAQRSAEPKATRLLTQASQAFGAALEVLTKADLPHLWAAAEDDLGNALTLLADRQKGAEAVRLLEESAKAHRASLEVFTRSGWPQDWAIARRNLAGTLRKQGMAMAYDDRDVRGALLAGVSSKADDGDLARNIGPEAAKLLSESVEAYREVLDVFTKAQFPGERAVTLTTLGSTLRWEASRTSGSEAERLLGQAAESYAATLEIFTKTNSPQDWAQAQLNVGSALSEQAKNSAGAGAAQLFGRAASAFRAALEVYERSAAPTSWAETQFHLGESLANEGELTVGPAAVERFSEAAGAFRAALTIYTRENWAKTQFNLGNALQEQGKGSVGPEAARFWDQAIQAYRAALNVFDKKDSPQLWAMAQNGLVNVFALQENWTAAVEANQRILDLYPDSMERLLLAEFIYQEHLFLYQKALDINRRRFDLDRSPDTFFMFAEKHLTTTKYDECLARWAEFRDSDLEAKNVPVRDAFRLACAFGAGKTEETHRYARLLLHDAQNLETKHPTLGGVKHFLGNEPVFAAAKEAWVWIFECLEQSDARGLANAVRTIEAQLRN